MHEVKVFDRSGNLKEVISVKKLNIRSKKQLEFPSLFMKNKRTGRPAEKTPEGQEKTPEGQEKTPEGQEKTPEGQGKIETPQT